VSAPLCLLLESYDTHLTGFAVTVTYPNGHVEWCAIEGAGYMDGMAAFRVAHETLGAVVTTRQIWRPRVLG
jgi:hypothetical protein